MHPEKKEKSFKEIPGETVHFLSPVKIGNPINLETDTVSYCLSISQKHCEA